MGRQSRRPCIERRGSAAVELIATQLSFDASMASTSANYDRRRDEWLLQADLASQRTKSRWTSRSSLPKSAVISQEEILPSQVSSRLSKRKKTRTFLEGKFTNAHSSVSLRMTGQLAALHSRRQKMAYELANLAERAAEYELGLAPREMRIAQPGSGHWDSLRKGLLAGDRLHQDLRRFGNGLPGTEYAQSRDNEACLPASAEPIGTARLTARRHL